MEQDLWRQDSAMWRSEEETADDSGLPAVRLLSAAEQFALSNLRLWWSSIAGAGPCPRALIRNGFIAANLDGAAHENFEAFMQMLATAAWRSPVICGTNESQVGDDELLLLRAVALCQQGHNGHAIMVLKLFLPATAYRVSLKSLVAFAVALLDRGLHLPMRTCVPLASDPTGPRYLPC